MCWAEGKGEMWGCVQVCNKPGANLTLTCASQRALSLSVWHAVEIAVHIAYHAQAAAMKAPA